MVSPLRTRNDVFFEARQGHSSAGPCPRQPMMKSTTCCLGSLRPGQRLLGRRSSDMPLITAFNLRKEDRLSDIENALRRALVSTPELKINVDEIDFVPILTRMGFTAG
jgi:hypothetical protein